MKTDEKYIQRTIELAKDAEKLDEVPVGALIVSNGEIIAEAINLREQDKCATHHAEILAIEEACQKLGGWRLPNCTLYVSLEPCPMCAGAIANARIEKVVFGAYDKRFGAYGSCFNLNDFPLNHKPEVMGGILEEECSSILTTYFQRKRKANRYEK